MTSVSSSLLASSSKTNAANTREQIENRNNLKGFLVYAAGIMLVSYIQHKAMLYPRSKLAIISMLTASFFINNYLGMIAGTYITNYFFPPVKQKPQDAPEVIINHALENKNIKYIVEESALYREVQNTLSLIQKCQLLVKRANQGEKIPIPDKLTCEQFEQLVRFRNLFLNCANTSLKSEFLSNDPFWDYRTYETGDILIYKYRKKTISVFANTPLEIVDTCIDLRGKILSHLFGLHAGIFFWVEKKSNDKLPFKAGVVRDYKIKLLNDFDRLNFQVLRLEIEKLLPPNFSQNLQTSLKLLFKKAINELCCQQQFIKLRDPKIFKMLQGKIANPIEIFFGILELLAFKHEDKNCNFHEIVDKFANQSEMLCSEFVAKAIIKAIDRINFILKIMNREQMRYPFNQNEVFEHLTPKRLEQILEKSGMLSKDRIDIIREVVAIV